MLEESNCLQICLAYQGTRLVFTMNLPTVLCLCYSSLQSWLTLLLGGKKIFMPCVYDMVDEIWLRNIVNKHLINIRILHIV